MDEVLLVYVRFSLAVALMFIGGLVVPDWVDFCRRVILAAKIFILEYRIARLEEKTTDSFFRAYTIGGPIDGGYPLYTRPSQKVEKVRQRWEGYYRQRDRLQTRLGEILPKS